MTMTPEEEREHLRAQLEEIGQGVIQEWMRIVDLEDVAGIQFRARVRWQDHQGACIVGESQYGDEYGAFRLTVHAEDLGPVPPIGPEDDPAQQFEDTCDPFSGELISASQDAELDRAGREIAAGDPNEKGDRSHLWGEDPEPVKSEVPMWVLRTWADVRKGDTVRMPGSEITASITDRLWHPSEDPRGESWHVVHDGTTEQWAHTRDRVVQPGECVIVSPDIQGSERGRWMIPTAPVEILLADGQSELDAIQMLGGWTGRLRGRLRIF